MTTTLEIITQAYREGNINGISVVPTDPQKAEGLARLNAVISSVLGFEVGEELTDWYVGTENVQADPVISWPESRWTRPVDNVRLLLNAGTAQTLFLPSKPSDGARIQAISLLGNADTVVYTLDANGMHIEGASSLVLTEADLPRVWFFRADLANWVPIASLAIDDEMPYPSEFDDCFITMLAMRLNPRYGRTMDGQSGSWMERSLRQLRARYRQRVIVPADIGVLSNVNLGINNFYSGGYQRGRGWMN